MKFTSTEKNNAIAFLNSFEKDSKEFKLLIAKACKEELENTELNVQGIALDIAKALFGDDFKSGRAGYNRADIDRIFSKDFVKKWFTLENTKTYGLNYTGSWVDFKKEHLSDKEEAQCKEAGKSFFKRLHDKRYTLIANTVAEIRNEQGTKTASNSKKKPLAELMKSVRTQLTAKITEREEGYDKVAILAELENLKKYIAEIA